MLQSGAKGRLEDLAVVILMFAMLTTVLPTRDAGKYLLGRYLLIQS